MKRLSVTLLLGILGGPWGCGPGSPAPTGRPLVISFQDRSWDGGTASGRELITPHYRIFTTSTSPEILQYLPGFLEAALTNYESLTGLDAPEGGRRMTVYMMATRAQWAALTRAVAPQHWKVYSAIRAGGYCHRGVCVFWDIGGIGSLSIAAHEGLHQFLAHRLADRLPAWAEEGLAAAAEGYQVDGLTVRFTPDRNPARFSDLRRGIVNDWLIPLEKLVTMDAAAALEGVHAERAVVYYAQLWALVTLLRSEPAYAEGFRRMLADAAAGRLGEALGVAPAAWAALRRGGGQYNRAVALRLLKRYITDDLAGLEREYQAFARRLAKLD